MGKKSSFVDRTGGQGQYLNKRKIMESKKVSAPLSQEINKNKAAREKRTYNFHPFQVPVVQTLDSAIRRINHYSAGKN